MRLDFSNSHQLITFLLSVALGAVFCILYDLFRFFHKKYSPPWIAVFLGDVLYFALTAVVTFCFFIMFSKGMIRVYVYFGELLGFIFCRFSLSKLFWFILTGSDKVITAVCNATVKPLIRFLKRAKFKAGKRIRNLARKLFVKKIKKVEKN